MNRSEKDNNMGLFYGGAKNRQKHTYFQKGGDDL
jgi:hypothetical protein